VKSPVGPEKRRRCCFNDYLFLYQNSVARWSISLQENEQKICKEKKYSKYYVAFAPVCVKILSISLTV